MNRAKCCCASRRCVASHKRSCLLKKGGSEIRERIVMREHDIQALCNRELRRAPVLARYFMHRDESLFTPSRFSTGTVVYGIMSARRFTANPRRLAGAARARASFDSLPLGTESPLVLAAFRDQPAAMSLALMQCDGVTFGVVDPG